MKRHSGPDCQDLPARFGRSSVLSQWCLFMNPKVNFTIHTHITTDDRSKFQWSTATYPEIIRSQGTRSRWSRGLMNCRVIQMINYCQMWEIQCGLRLKWSKWSSQWSWQLLHQLHHHNFFYPVHNNLEGSSAHQPPVHLQCVLEEKRVVPLPSAVLFWFQLTNVLQMYQDPLMEEGRFPKSSEMEDQPWRGM